MRIQRLANIKTAKAYGTTSHEALCVLTGSTPVIIELENTAKLHHITRGEKIRMAYMTRGRTRGDGPIQLKPST